mgnify:CR=1 FL=1
MRNVFWRHNHRYHHKFMQYKGRPNRIKWKMELRRWRHSIFHFSFSIFHSRWKMELIWRRMYFRFSDINRKWKMDCWRHSFNIFAWMKNEKWKMEVDIPFFIWWHQMKNQNNGMYTDPHAASLLLTLWRIAERSNFNFGPPRTTAIDTRPGRVQSQRVPRFCAKYSQVFGIIASCQSIDDRPP